MTDETKIKKDEERIAEAFEELAAHFHALTKTAPEVRRAAALCVEALKTGNKILFCGNGGSASQSQHLAAELVGRYKIDRPAMAGAALTVDTSILTAVGNDYGYDDVFRRQVEGIGRAGDVLFGLSTSGNSRNIVRAFEQAKKMRITTVAMVGANACPMSRIADVTLAVPSTVSNTIQEMHLAIGHLICGDVERAFYG